MDDIVILSTDEKQGMVNLKRILQVASSNGLDIKWSKCQFLLRRINFSGYIIENSSIHPSKEKTSAIQKYPTPEIVKTLARFLGLT